MELDIVQFIQTVGVPTAISFALGFYVYKSNENLRLEWNKREERLLNNNEKLAGALDKAADAIADATKQHDLITQRLTSVECKVDDLHKKVDSLQK